MAILKHIPSHNMQYSDVITYLTKAHNEENGEPILDEHGEMIDRERFLIAGINCTPDNFAELCMKDSIHFNTNRKASDVKTHQYVLSFDPKDTEKGLTLEAAQEEGLKFARKNFPGHRVIVCAHPDGANGSGNIHVHIIISALRFEEREPDAAYMKMQADGVTIKESEYKAGCKHQDTAKLRHYLNEQLQEYCRENGYTVAESKPKKKVTNAEYRAKKEGQKWLNETNEVRREHGRAPVQTDFKTKKDDLRTAIEHAASVSKSWDEFALRLRNGYTRQVEQNLEPPKIPYQERQEMWAKYKAFNDGFWTKYKHDSEMYNERVSEGFADLKRRRDLEWRKKNRRNSDEDRAYARDQLTFASKSDIDFMKGNIDASKSKQQQLRLFKNTYQAYAKALKIALANNMYAEAKECLDQMEELRRRQEGYWSNRYVPNATETEFSAAGGTRYHVTFMQTTEYELINAEKMLDNVTQWEKEIKESKENPVFEEEEFPIDVKVTRGAISFKHPDLDRWTRGKSLGADYEIEAIAKTLERNAALAIFEDLDLQEEEFKELERPIQRDEGR